LGLRAKTGLGGNPRKGSAPQAASSRDTLTGPRKVSGKLLVQDCKVAPPRSALGLYRQLVPEKNKRDVEGGGRIAKENGSPNTP